MSQNSIELFFAQVCIILLFALIFRYLAKKINVPTVVGEIIAGIVLGPTVLGSLDPALYNCFFFENPYCSFGREIIETFGLLFFIFITGLTLNLKALRQQKNNIFLISAFGMLVPMGLGYSSVIFFPDIWGSEIENKTVLACFIGIALSTSALPVIARILIDIGIIKTKIGTIILSTAVVNDLCVWLLFAFIMKTFNYRDLQYIVLIILVLLLIGLFLNRFNRYISNNGFFGSSELIGFSIIGLIISAISMEFIGFHLIFGAFLFGIFLSGGQTSLENGNAFYTIKKFSLNFFTPIYFTSIGLKLNFQQLDVSLVLLITFLACLGKVGGTLIGALLSKLSTGEALVIGFGMNVRGVMELILSSLAFEAKLIDQRIFIALISMAIITSVISGSIMQRLLFKRKDNIRSVLVDSATAKK
jgi:Kef-type K+ transport system membrane component KefB